MKYAVSIAVLRITLREIKCSQSFDPNEVFSESADEDKKFQRDKHGSEFLENTLHSLN